MSIFRRAWEPELPLPPQPLDHVEVVGGQRPLYLLNFTVGPVDLDLIRSAPDPEPEVRDRGFVGKESAAGADLANLRAARSTDDDPGANAAAVAKVVSESNRQAVVGCAIPGDSWWRQDAG